MCNSKGQMWLPLLLLIVNSQAPGTSCVSLEERQNTGTWSDWTQWSDCSATCDQGARVRARHCLHGSDCVGNILDQEACIINICNFGNPGSSVDGNWGLWNSWGECSRSCDIGVTIRSRQCNSPVPMNGGSYCVGEAQMFKSCDSGTCPIDGGWSDYHARPCSVTCGIGVVVSVRTCTNPVPQYGGKTCSGSSTAVTGCVMPHCVIDGEWGHWSDLTTCRVICGEGVRYRHRECNNPPPGNGGAFCQGDALDGISCSNGLCPPDFHICDKLRLLAAITPPESSNPCEPDTTDIISMFCNAPLASDHWKLGIQIQGNCETLPLYSPVGYLNTSTKQKHFGILTACFVDSMEIAFKTCTNKIEKRKVRMGASDSDYHLVHW